MDQEIKEAVVEATDIAYQIQQLVLYLVEFGNSSQKKKFLYLCGGIGITILAVGIITAVGIAAVPFSAILGAFSILLIIQAFKYRGIQRGCEEAVKWTKLNLSQHFPKTIVDLLFKPGTVKSTLMDEIFKDVCKSLQLEENLFQDANFANLQLEKYKQKMVESETPVENKKK